LNAEGENEEEEDDLDGTTNEKVYKSKHLQAFQGGDGRHTRTATPFLKSVVNGSKFELACTAVIFLNAAVMAVEMQYRGFDVGYFLRLEDYTRPADQTWPWAETLFLVMDWFCIIWFTVELLMRVICEPLDAWRSGWIWFDVIIILSAWAEIIDLLDFDPSVLRLMRLLRLGRVLKMMRVFHMFDALFLLIRSLKASMGVLFWSFTLLLFLQISSGMLIMQFVQPYITDASRPEAQRLEAFMYFGTFTKTMITMFEVTFANWVPACRSLMETIHEGFAAIFIVYRCMVAFAVIKVIAAVFLTETTRIVQGDSEMQIRRKNKFIHQQKTLVRAIFEEMDSSGDGMLTIIELQQALQDPVLNTWASTLELTFDDLANMFDIIDDGDGKVSIDEFLEGALHMKGAARGSDMAMVVKYARRIDRGVLAMRRNLCTLEGAIDGGDSMSLGMFP
jgi:hypothetical protein